MATDPTGGGFQVVAEERVEPTRDMGQERRETVERFLRLAHQRFRTVVDAEAMLRQSMLDDLRFRASEQWPPHIKSMREQDNRPCLTVNRLPQFIRQVTNNQRASRPSVQVNPAGDISDPDVAEVLQGLVRHIETKSDADVAYTTAGEHQCTMGRGYIRVVTDYVDDDPVQLDQEIQIARVPNPFSVYLDPTSQKPDGSDVRYGFVVEDLSKEEYQNRYPDSELASLSQFTSTGNAQEYWLPDGMIRIAEYFYIEEKREVMVVLEGPDGMRMKQPKSALKTTDPDQLPMGVTIVAEREALTRTVRWALINAVEVLEGNEDKTAGLEWPGRFIPLIPVLGDEININGVTDYRGIVRDAKDAQRMYNYWVSAQTEMIALAPRAPFVAAEGQFEGHEAKWKTANVRNYPYLEYKPKSIAGQPTPPPQRQSWEPPIQAMTMAIAQSDNDLKTTGGFHDASLGVRGPQESGRALRTRQQQDEMANSHYLDNLARAIRHVGRILVDLIPKIYDTARVMQITGMDEQQRTVMVYSGQANLPAETMGIAPPGVEGIFDVGMGKYDVTVSVGPSFQTKREAGVEALVQFVQAYPNVFPMIGDLIADNMDWPGAKQVAARLKRMLPPQLQDTVDASQIPEPVRAKMQQIEAQLQQVTQAYEEAQSTIATDQVKSQERVALKERELAADAATQERDLQAKLQLEEVRQQGESARTLAKIEQERAAQILDTKITQLESLISRNVEQSNREQDRFERLAGGGRGAQASRPPSPKLGGPPPPSQPVSPPMGPPEREIVAPRPVVEEEVKEEEVL
jgi:hypothetical protein